LAPEALAAANSSSPCAERSALLAVMTGLPNLSAVKMIVLARVVPPTKLDHHLNLRVPHHRWSNRSS
jgi:hypothetical protein